MPRILLIYHSNICNKNCGINSYLYNIFKLLNKRGFDLDIFVPESFDTNWKIEDRGFIHNVFRQEKKTKESSKQTQINPNRLARAIERIANKITKLRKTKSNEENLPKKKLDWIDSDTVRRFKKVIENNKYDYAVFSYVYYAKLVDYLPENTLKICSVSDFVSIQEMQTGHYKFGEVIEEEIAAIKKFDKAMFISSDEMVFFSNFVDEVEFSYLPHCLSSSKEYKNTVKDIDILFVGSDNVHNVRGVNWFLESVYPKIKDKKYNIVIAGKISTKINQDKYDKILFLDFVEDLDALYLRVKVAISPLRSGTGIKIKIIEAMTHNIPMVCTRNSLVGFMEKVNNGCVIADEANEFAKAINDVLSDKKLRVKLSDQARKQCEKYYNEGYMEKTIANIFK